MIVKAKQGTSDKTEKNKRGSSPPSPCHLHTQGDCRRRTRRHHHHHPSFRVVHMSSLTSRYSPLACPPACLPTHPLQLITTFSPCVMHVHFMRGVRACMCTYVCIYVFSPNQRRPMTSYWLGGAQDMARSRPRPFPLGNNVRGRCIFPLSPLPFLPPGSVLKPHPTPTRTCSNSLVHRVSRARAIFAIPSSFSKFFGRSGTQGNQGHRILFISLV